MAQPQLLPQANQGMASISQGIASIQQLGQFLEQKRQFDEDQQRLNNLQTANWGAKMIDELIKSTKAGSIKDVARDYPELLSLVMQKGLNISAGEVMPMITELVNSPYNADESFNFFRSIYHEYGAGEADGPTLVKKSLAKLQQTKAAAIATSAAATSAIPESSATTVTPGSTRTTAQAETVDPNLVIKDIKRKLYDVYQAAQMELGKKVTISADLFAVLADAEKANPTVSDAIKSFRVSEMDNFLADVKAGKWTPPIQEAKTEQTAIASPVLPETDIPTLRRFAEKLGADKFKVPIAQVQEKTLLDLPENNSNTWRQFVKDEGISPTVIPPLVTPSLSTQVGNKEKGVATPSAEDQGIKVAFNDFVSSMGKGAGAQKKAAMFLQKQLTPVMAKQMQSNPEGIKQLVSAASALLNNPTVARGMALMQNAPSVYATDLEATGNTVQSKMALAKGMLDLEKLGLDVELKRAELIGQGITNQNRQNEYIMSSITIAAIESGVVVPPALYPQFKDLADRADYALKARDAAQAKNQPGLMDTANAEYNKANRAWKEAMLALTKALKTQDSDVAKRLAATLEDTMKFVSGRVFLGIFNASNVSKGQFVAEKSGGTVGGTPTVESNNLKKIREDAKKAGVIQ